MIQIQKLALVAVGAVLLALSCSENNDSTYVRPKGRGSDACQAWQKAFCDLVVECGSSSEAACVDSYYGVTCNSDEKAQSCATSLDKATCVTGLPTECNILDLADRAPAAAACNAFVAGMCQRAVDCAQGTLEECTADAEKQLDCTKAIGYRAPYETCLSDMSKMACSATKLPDSCTDVIIVL